MGKKKVNFFLIHNQNNTDLEVSLSLFLTTSARQQKLHSTVIANFETLIVLKYF
jgi:hypothetical protein